MRAALISPRWQRRQRAQQCPVSRRGIGVDHPHLSLSSKQVGIITGTPTNQRVKVVGQHLGKHIDQGRMLRQRRHRFQFEPMLEPFVRRLNALTLVVQITKNLWREIPLSILTPQACQAFSKKQGNTQTGVQFFDHLQAQAGGKALGLKWD